MAGTNAARAGRPAEGAHAPRIIRIDARRFRPRVGSQRVSPGEFAAMLAALAGAWGACLALSAAHVAGIY